MSITLPIVTDSESSIEEEILTTEQKIQLLWRSIMGYGYGTGRVPGLLEQMAEGRKKTDLYTKVGLGLISFFGLLLTHSSIEEIIKVALTLFH